MKNSTRLIALAAIGACIALGYTAATSRLAPTRTTAAEQKSAPAEAKAARHARSDRGWLRASLPTHAIGLHRGSHHAGLDLQKAGQTATVAEERAEHPHHPHGRCRAGPGLDLWRRDQHTNTWSRGQDGHFLQPLSLDRDVLAHARLAALRSQSHAHRLRPDLRAGERLGRLCRHHPEIVGDRPRGAQELRLQDRRLGQVAQHARRADHRRRAVRLLAHRLRL